MSRAVLAGVIIAESDEARRVEGMTYFPVASVDTERLVPSPTTSRCFWKGKASYWHVVAGDEIAVDSAFAYRRPWPWARRFVSDRIAFWREVRVVE